METREEPLVTTVITTCNRSRDIVKRALDSIIKQTYKNIEIIVINDYPIDKRLMEQIENLIVEFSNIRNIKYIVVEKNGGACKARNIALNIAKGKYIAYLDDDDEWLPDKIQRQIDQVNICPDAAIVYCNAIIRYGDTGKEHRRFEKMQPVGKMFYDILGKNIIGSCSFPMFRKDILLEVGGFREDMPALQDWELYLRILKIHDVVTYVAHPVAIYYFHEGERISAHPENRIRAFENIHIEFQEELQNNRKSASNFYLMGTYFYSLCKNMRIASKYYLKGVSLDPFRIRRNIKDLFRMMGRIFIKPKKV